MIMFIYISFPYKVLKESIAVSLTEETGFLVTIDDLKPNFGLSVSMLGLNIRSTSGQVVKLQEITAGLNPFYLFLGKAKVYGVLQNSKNSYIKTDLSFSLLDFLGSNPAILPSSVVVDAKDFTFDDIVSLLIQKIPLEQNTALYLKPLFDKVKIKGKLSSTIDIDLNRSDMSLSEGTVALDFKNFEILFDKSLQIPDQIFSKSHIAAVIKNSVFTIDNKSALLAKNLSLILAGKIALKSSIDKSLCDVNIDLELRDELQNAIGSILQTIFSNKEEGKIKFLIKGPLSPKPTVEII